MAKKGENIYRRRDGRWEGRYIKGRKENGKPIFGSVYARQYNDVKEKLILIKAEQIGANKCDFNICPLFCHWSEYWLKVCSQPYVKPGTLALYQRTLDKHLLPRLGVLRLDELTEEVLQGLVSALRETLAPSTLAGVYRLLKAILKEANSRGALAHMPPKIRLEKPVKREVRVLTLAEQQRLEREALRAGEYGIVLTLYTGLRVGELCALRWSDLDFENHQLTVHHSAKRVRQENGKTHVALQSPKTDCSLRDIPLLAVMSRLLRTLPRTSPFIFPGHNGQCMDPRTMQFRLAALTRRLGMAGVHMHTLRHTYATRCLEKRVGYETLSVLLGHSSPDITLRCYCHTTQEEKRRCVSRLKPLVLFMGDGKGGGENGARAGAGAGVTDAIALDGAGAGADTGTASVIV